MKPAFRTGLAAAGACLCLAGAAARDVDARVNAAARQGRPAAAGGAGEIEVLQLRPNFFMIAGNGANIAVQIGDDGVVVVDAGLAARADAVVAAIKKLTPQPIRYIIDTSADADHVGGNETLSKAGQTLFTNPGSIGITGDFLGGVASILAAQKVLERMTAPTGRAAPYPIGATPTETFDFPRKYMYLNGEGIEMLHQPAAHSDGDVMVFFRRSDVVVAGDVLDTTRFPVIDIARGGSVSGEIAALNRLVDLAIPSVPIVSREAGTLVVPGHGRICDQTDVADYRDMLTIVRDRIRDLRKAGMTLAQIKATSPTRGYTKRYGSDAGTWTTDNFVEAVFRSLAQEKP
jgi:glyoxylase-like metal-dependent hydrolase (beta-lactamase superfamily II)